MSQNRHGFFRRFFHSPLSNILPIMTSMKHDKESEALLRHLVRETRDQEAWETPLLATRFVVVDCETTGVNPQTDSLLSIGAVEMHGATIVPERTFETLVRPEPAQNIPPLITDLTGLRDEDLADAPELVTVLPPFLHFAKQAVLVMHHAAHDVLFLNAALTKKYHTKLHHRVIDTCDVANWLHPGRTTFTLDEWLNHYEIPVTERHTALGEAQMTAALWSLLLEEAVAKGVNTLGELLEQVASAKRSQ